MVMKLPFLDYNLISCIKHAIKMVEALIFQIESEGILVIAEPLSLSLPDPDDEAFLEVALACPDTVIITGNNKHFPPKLCEPVKVLTPAQFVTLWKRDGR
jgi:predicted nucleic acid-binding protein